MDRTHSFVPRAVSTMPVLASSTRRSWASIALVTACMHASFHACERRLWITLLTPAHACWPKGRHVHLRHHMAAFQTIRVFC